MHNNILLHKTKFCIFATNVSFNKNFVNDDFYSTHKSFTLLKHYLYWSARALPHCAIFITTHLHAHVPLTPCFSMYLYQHVVLIKLILFNIYFFKIHYNKVRHFIMCFSIRNLLQKRATSKLTTCPLMIWDNSFLSQMKRVRTRKLSNMQEEKTRENAR